MLYQTRMCFFYWTRKKRLMRRLLVHAAGPENLMIIFFCLNINGFSPKLVCALIFWRSGLVLLMGKFHQFLTELSAYYTIMVGYYRFKFLYVFCFCVLFRKTLFLFFWGGGGGGGNVSFFLAYFTFWMLPLLLCRKNISTLLSAYIFIQF